MRLAVPLTAPGEAALLLEAGATEFYCGIQTSRWQSDFGDHDSISRRQGTANLATLDALGEIVSETSRLGAPLFLALNGSYTQEQLAPAVRLAAAFEEMGGAGLMIMDIALMLLLKKSGSKLIRGLSLLAAVSSRSALASYRELGVTRVVFPRFLQLAEMREITRHFPEMDAESIVLFDKCACIDGYCRFLHAVGYRDCPGNIAVPAKTIHAYDTTYRLPACFELFGMPLPQPACAACYLQALAGAGVTVFKVGGRGRSLDTRLSGVRFLTDAGGINRCDSIRELYERSFGSPCNQNLCYYPEAMRYED